MVADANKKTDQGDKGQSKAVDDSGKKTPKPLLDDREDPRVDTEDATLNEKTELETLMKVEPDVLQEVSLGEQEARSKNYHQTRIMMNVFFQI